VGRRRDSEGEYNAERDARQVERTATHELPGHHADPQRYSKIDASRIDAQGVK
jgi:hypothetical protein